MRRRDFIALAGGAAAAWPLGARAQQAAMPRIGYVMPFSPSDAEAQARHAAFRDTLEKLGWVEGRNIHIEYRWDMDTPEQRRLGAADIVGLAPKVIVAGGSPVSEALRRATSSIPIVFAGATDPLSSGLVDSMAHPGGNLTGFPNYEFSMGGKWLEILKEVAPGIKRVLVLAAPDNAGNLGLLRAIETAAPAVSVELTTLVVAPDGSAIERAIDDFAKQPNGGMIVLPQAQFMENRDRIVALASRHHLPAIYTNRRFISTGGLMSYDTDAIDLYRRAASYVDRILRGAKVGELPVQNPTKFELVINLKVAKALGLTVPLPLLARADEVIE